MLNTNKKLGYDRYLTVHLYNEYDNSYDFINAYNQKVLIEKLKNKPEMQPINKLIIAGEKLYPIEISELPNKAHVSIAVPIQDIDKHIVNKDYINVIKWISNLNTRGKLRISSHGNLDGTFSNDGSSVTKANNFVLWMIKNGLCKNFNIVNNNELQKTGLITICLFACLAASYMSQKGSYDNELKQFQSAQNSSIDLIIKSLQNNGYFGIQVTGSSEELVNFNGKKYRLIPNIPDCLDTKYDPIHFSSLPQRKASWAKSFSVSNKIPSGALQYNLPIGWKASTNNITKETYIYLPDVYNISPTIQNKIGDINDHWVLHHNENNSTYAPTVIIPNGWQLDLITKTIQPPMGWTAKIASNGLHYLEGIQTKVVEIIVNNHNYKLHYFELIGHSEAKIRQISNNTAQNDVIVTRF